MKHRFVYVVIVLFLLCASNCKTNLIYKTADIEDKQGVRTKRQFFTVNRINFLQINKTLYAAELELTNDKYKEFLGEIIISNPEKYDLCKIDTSVWIKHFAEYGLLASKYSENKKFSDYPVVGISWFAANEYCKWLTEIAETELKSLKCQIRLPTETEWKSMIANPDPLGFDVPCPNGYDTTVNMFCFNHYVLDSAKEAKDGGYFPVMVNSYWPNAFGIFNLHGNVAEMTSDKTICKGGGWNDSFNDCSLFTRKYYPLPSAEVGVRLVAVISDRGRLE
jgi:formylglycine-generating enzyme required for sulfatase activity